MINSLNYPVIPSRVEGSLCCLENNFYGISLASASKTVCATVIAAVKSFHLSQLTAVRHWLGSCLKSRSMNSSGHLTVSETAAKRMRKTKASVRKPKGRSRNGSTKPASASPDLPAAGTLARTKALLLAALRVWELKHRVGD
jgi:hypothetical protein